MLAVQTIRVDPDGRRAWREDEELKLSRKEFDLLHVLIRNAGRIVSRETLMREVWHTDFWTSSKTVDVHLGWLRRKIGDDARQPHLITTLRGRGLRFEIASDAGAGGGDPASGTGTPAFVQPPEDLQVEERDGDGGNDTVTDDDPARRVAMRHLGVRRAAEAALLAVQARPA